MRLADLQARFVQLIAGDVAASGMFAPAPVPPDHAIHVHRATIEGAFVRLLSLGYPTVEALVGAEFFVGMALAYRGSRAPDDDPTLARYGEDFASFIATYEHSRDLPYLADVARLDHAVEQCQAARDDYEDFAIDPLVSLELPRSLTLIALYFPAVEIRAAIFENDDGALEALDIAPRGRAAAIWRRGRSVVVSALAPSAMTFLTKLKTGATADAALAAAAEQPVDVLTTLQTDVFGAAFARVRPTQDEVNP